MRVLKFIFSILLFLVIVASVAFFVIPSEKIAKAAFDQIEKSTGRKVTATGDVSLRVFPVLGVRIEGVEVANAAWSDQPTMLSAQNLNVGVKTLPLLQRRIEVSTLEMVSPNILLELSQDGVGNWVFDQEASTPNTGAETQSETSSEAAQSPDVSLGTVTVTDGALTYIDHLARTEQSIRDIDMTVNWPSMQAPLSLELSTKYNSNPVSITMTAVSPSAVMQGDETQIDLTGRIAGNDISFAGNLSTAPMIKGQVTATLSDISALLSTAGTPGVVLPDFIGNSADISSSMAFQDATLALGDLDVGLTKNHLRGDIAINLENKPTIKGSLDLGQFDLRSGAVALGNGGSATSGSSTGTGWSKSNIDLSSLGAVDATISVQAQSLLTDAISLGSLNGDIVLDNARAVATLKSLAVHDGAASGEVIVNARKGLSSAANLVVTQVALNPLLSDLAEIDSFSGLADVRFSYLTSGNSVDALMRNMSGDGAFSLAQGRYEGVDLDQLMRSGDVGSGTTVFDDLSATFTIAEGVVQNKDLALSLPNFVTSGAGWVNLGDQSIDYLLSPKALKARDGKGLSVPVRIKGSWQSPKIIPDLEAALEQNLAEERAKAEAEIKARAEEEKKKLEAKAKKKVSDALGVEVKDGQKIEDAVKQKLEDKAKEGLLNLLGKN